MSEPAREVARNVLRFVALTFVVSAVFASLIIHTGTMATGRWLYVKGAMWSPAIAVLILRSLRARPFSGVGWRWGGGYQAAAYLLAVGASAVVYIIAWSTGLAGFPNMVEVAGIARDFGWVGLPTAIVVPAYMLFTATFGLLPALPSALGEEIGWRGYLVPELARVCSFTTTALVTGVIWTSWHLPMILFTDFVHGVPVWYGLACFSAFIIASSFICAWLRLKSRSIWPTVVLHAANNLMLQDVFAPLTIHTPASRFFVGEFGCMLPLLAIVGAVICWRRRAEVEPSRTVVRELALWKAPRPRRITRPTLRVGPVFTLSKPVTTPQRMRLKSASSEASFSARIKRREARGGPPRVVSGMRSSSGTANAM